MPRGPAPPPVPRALSRRLPLIDLHLHLEGSLPPSVLSALARRHGLAVPSTRQFDGFSGFLKSFGAVCDLLRDEDDFERAARGVIGRCAAIGLAHVEILFSPQVFLRRGIPLQSILPALLRARRGARPGGPSVVYILDGVRQWGGDWFDSVLREAAPWAGRGLAGIGIGGDESALSCREFAPAYARARALGLRTTVHAGEAAGPESMWEAMRWLRPDRIGHGIAAAADEDLRAELRACRVVLEICPSSNRATGVIGAGAAHPIRALFDAGLRVTVGSDDGAFFGCDARTEMQGLLADGTFSLQEAFTMQLEAARGAFLGEKARRALERRMRQRWRRVDQVEAAATPRRAFERT